MKRLIAAGILLGISICIYFYGQSSIEKFCDNKVKSLNKAIEYIESGEDKKAIKEIKQSKTSNILIPYMYKNDVYLINDELCDAVNYLSESKRAESKISIKKTIYYIKEITKAQKFSWNSFL